MGTCVHVPSTMVTWLGLTFPASHVAKLLMSAGLIAVVVLMWKMALHLFVAFRNFVWARFRQVNFVKKYGEWAVVTGATAGLGKEFAKEYARRGMKVMLISRNEDKLKSVADEIRGETGAEVAYLVVDFAQLTDDKLRMIDDALQGLDLGVLVNNVGALTAKFKYLTEMTDKEVRDMLKVNVEGLVSLTKIVLPRMSRRRKGAVVNLASSAAAQPLPLFAVFAATKAFVRWFSVAVSYEYRPRGITVQCLEPYFVRTPMTRGFAPFFLGPLRAFYPGPATFVRSAACTLPYARETTGYWLHGLQAYFSSFLGCDFWCRSSLFVLDFMGDFEKLTR